MQPNLQHQRDSYDSSKVNSSNSRNSRSDRKRNEKSELIGKGPKLQKKQVLNMSKYGTKNKSHTS